MSDATIRAAAERAARELFSEYDSDTQGCMQGYEQGAVEGYERGHAEGRALGALAAHALVELGHDYMSQSHLDKCLTCRGLSIALAKETP
jgi:flagellar biosynthesis/type III secretory pathway protein FliH